MNSESLRAFGRSLFHLREDRGLKQDELAEMADISTHHLSALENGHAEPGFHVLRKLRRALECRWEELMGEDEPEPVTRALRRNHEKNIRRTWA